MSSRGTAGGTTDDADDDDDDEEDEDDDEDDNDDEDEFEHLGNGTLSLQKKQNLANLAWSAIFVLTSPA